MKILRYVTFLYDMVVGLPARLDTGNPSAFQEIPGFCFADMAKAAYVDFEGHVLQSMAEKYIIALIIFIDRNLDSAVF